MKSGVDAVTAHVLVNHAHAALGLVQTVNERWGEMPEGQRRQLLSRAEAQIIKLCAAAGVAVRGLGADAL